MSAFVNRLALKIEKNTEKKSGFRPIGEKPRSKRDGIRNAQAARQRLSREERASSSVHSPGSSARSAATTPSAA